MPSSRSFKAALCQSVSSQGFVWEDEARSLPSILRRLVLHLPQQSVASRGGVGLPRRPERGVISEVEGMTTTRDPLSTAAQRRLHASMEASMEAHPCRKFPALENPRLVDSSLPFMYPTLARAPEEVSLEIRWWWSSQRLICAGCPSWTAPLHFPSPCYLPKHLRVQKARVLSGLYKSAASPVV